ncbi:MAG: LysE family translocator [Verrucomicrobiae bacterium]|nr:LysE family translocator [Verrucomicrobiae bacterium]
MSTHILFLYLATWTLLALTPGPVVMCAMTQATRYGFRKALIGIAGIQMGHCALFVCVAFGLAALLATSSTAFTVIRIIGALYLFCLGVRIIAVTFRTHRAEKTAASAPARRSLFLEGFAIQVTNPEQLLFMSAFLPQFIQPEHSLLVQLSVLLALTIVVDVMVLSAYSYCAMRGSQSFRASGVTVWMERVFGTVLICFGIRLFFVY